MPESSSIRKTLPVNGSLLRKDRIAAGLTQEALLASCDIAFHIGTLRRAERSENISEAYLASLAKALGQDIARYTLHHSRPSSAEGGIDITGEWTAYYVQDHAGSPPYIVEEMTLFSRVGVQLTGYSESDYRGIKIREDFINLAVTGDMLTGSSVVKGWGDLTGAANVQAVISRGNDWMDGYASWYDSDTRNIHCSRYILVRNASRFKEDFSAEAKALMQAELEIFAARFSRT